MRRTDPGRDGATIALKALGGQFTAELETAAAGLQRNPLISQDYEIVAQSAAPVFAGSNLALQIEA